MERKNLIYLSFFDNLCFTLAWYKEGSIGVRKLGRARYAFDCFRPSFLVEYY